MSNPQPEWQPIETLPSSATMMDATLEVYMDQVKNLALTFYDRTKWDRPTLISKNVRLAAKKGLANPINSMA